MRQQAGIPTRMTVTDQNGAAAQLSGAQYASVMGAYNAFQHRVKTSIVKVLSEVAQLPGGVAVQMRYSFGTNMVQVIVRPVIAAPATSVAPDDSWLLLLHYDPFAPNKIIYINNDHVTYWSNESPGQNYSYFHLFGMKFFGNEQSDYLVAEIFKSEPNNLARIYYDNRDFFGSPRWIIGVKNGMDTDSTEVKVFCLKTAIQ